MVLGLLLARGGIRDRVLEKHSDFLRDFRGDTVHASTLALLDELGLGPEFARLPGLDTIRNFDDVKLLDVKLDRVRRWATDGLLLIGDPAHAMSPVGGYRAPTVARIGTPGDRGARELA